LEINIGKWNTKLSDLIVRKTQWIKVMVNKSKKTFSYDFIGFKIEHSYISQMITQIPPSSGERLKGTVKKGSCRR